jgi:osmotically-inducible protein OsmY
MTQRNSSNDPYLMEHVREALTSDPRSAGLEFDVVDAGGTLRVNGTVSTAQRRNAAQEVLDERFPHDAIINDLTVQEFPEPTRVEHIA